MFIFAKGYSCIRQGVKALKNPVPKNEKHSHPIIISVRLSDRPILYSLLFCNDLTHGQYLPCFFSSGATL